MLVVAGSLLRAQEGQVESDVLFRALRDFNIPKILSQDMVIFTGLLQDLFPGVDPPRKRDMEFEKVCLMLHISYHTLPNGLAYTSWTKSSPAGQLKHVLDCIYDLHITMLIDGQVPWSHGQRVCFLQSA